jgi:hypothetical protein
VGTPQTDVPDHLGVLLRSTGQEKGEREERKTAARLMSASVQ